MYNLEIFDKSNIPEVDVIDSNFLDLESAISRQLRDCE